LDCTLLKILFHEDVLDDIVFDIVFGLSDQADEFLSHDLPLGSIDLRGWWYTFGFAQATFFL